MLTRRSMLPILTFPAIHAQKKRMFDDAIAYERFMGRWSRVLAPLLADFTGIPEAGNVLDVGSGTGALAFAIAAQHPKLHVTGIDPSKNYVAYAASRNRFGHRVHFETGDGQQLRFANASFGASLSLLVFNFIPDPARAIHEVRRVTKHGGPVSAAVWDYGSGMRMLRTFWDAAAGLHSRAEKLDERHFALSRPGALRELWRNGGLENVEDQPLEFAMQFASFNDFWDAFLLGQGPAGAYVAGLGPDEKNKLREEVQRRLPPASATGAFTLPARAWAVRGTVP